MGPNEKYADLVRRMTGQPGVTNLSEGRGFGSSGQLKVGGRIFAMLVRDALVVKLPRGRVDDLVASRNGTRFDAGKGRPMREWFVVSPTSNMRWVPLALEAMTFVKEER